MKALAIILMMMVSNSVMAKKKFCTQHEIEVAKQRTYGFKMWLEGNRIKSDEIYLALGNDGAKKIKKYNIPIYDKGWIYFMRDKTSRMGKDRSLRIYLNGVLRNPEKASVFMLSNTLQVIKFYIKATDKIEIGIPANSCVVGAWAAQV